MHRAHALLLVPFIAPLASAQSRVALEGETAPPRPTVPHAPSAADPIVHPDGAVTPLVEPPTYLPDPSEGSSGAADDVEPAPISAGRALAPDRDRLYFDEQDGVHWVRGRSFKASAHPDGFTFFPFLGAQAERNWPVRFRLASATFGDTPVALASSAAVSRFGDDYVLDRGPVDVEYQVAVDGVEQLFHVERGRAEGALVVTLDVETDLVGSPDGAGLRFEGPEGGVRYGAAVAFDASGFTVEVPVRLDGSALTLTVPAAFVDESVGRITIDPLVTSFSIDDVTGDQSNVDAGFSRNGNVFLYVYEDTFSGADTDVYMTVIDSAGTEAAAGYVDFSSADWLDPEVATLNGDDVALIVAQEFVELGDSPIRGRLYDTLSQGFTGSAFEIADTGLGGSLTWSNARPDVGGNRAASTDLGFLVCWQRTLSSGGTFARYRTVSATGSLGAVRATGPSTSANSVRDVRVSECTGDTSTTNVWCFCFANRRTDGTNELWAGQINVSGSASSTPAVVRSSTTVNYSTPDVSDALVIDGNDPAYVVVYDDFVPGNIDTVAVLCRDSSAVLETDVNVLEHAVPGVDRDTPRVATTLERFVVAYAEDVDDIWTTYVTSLDLIEGNQLSVSERRLAGPQSSGAEIRELGIASRWAGGLASRWVGVGWDHAPSAFGPFDAFGMVARMDNQPSPAYQYCEGTVNSTGDRGFLRLEGSRDASTVKSAVGEAIPPNQFCLLVAGSGFGLMPALGGGEGTLCLGGTLGRYNDQLAAADASGVVTFTINPANIPAGGSFFTAQPGVFYQFQVWHRDVGGAGATSNLTNAVTILFN
ncbi:MAG: hypothetical protein AAFU73_11265 [Planctomycetota bacterium]